MYDAESEISAVVVGSGIVLIQLCAVVPGLLPVLLLCLPLVLPPLLLGLVLALPVAAWRGVARLARGPEG